MNEHQITALIIIYSSIISVGACIITYLIVSSTKTIHDKAIQDRVQSLGNTMFDIIIKNNKKTDKLLEDVEILKQNSCEFIFRDMIKKGYEYKGKNDNGEYVFKEKNER